MGFAGKIQSLIGLIVAHLQVLVRNLSHHFSETLDDDLHGVDRGFSSFVIGEIQSYLSVSLCSCMWVQWLVGGLTSYLL